MLFYDEEEVPLLEKLLGPAIYNPFHTPAIEVGSKRSSELVILVHGWMSGQAHLQQFSDYLKNTQGYSVYRLELPTTFGSLENLIDEVESQLKAIDYGKTFKDVHFVGHSFGGLIIRGILARYKEPNIRSVVTIGSPFQGSNLAARLVDRMPILANLSWSVKNAKKIQEISDKAKINPKIKVGLIAGIKSYSIADIGETEFQMRIGVFQSVNDGTVEKYSAFGWNGPVIDKTTFKCNHIELILDKKVWKATSNFLQKNKFR